MSARVLVRAPVALLAGALLAGCYSYAPVETPSPGSTVRIHVPVRSAVPGSRVREESIAFEGTVLAFSDSLLLETRSRREYGAFREVFELDTLRVHPASLAGMEERTFSKPKTYAFSALVTAGAAGLIYSAWKAAGGQGGDGPPGNGPITPAIVVTPILDAALRLLGR